MSMHRRRIGLFIALLGTTVLAGCQQQHGWVQRTWQDVRYERGWVGRGEAVRWVVSDDPDLRRRGIAVLNRKGWDDLPRTEQYVRTLAHPQAEASATVRGAAVRAQAHAGETDEALATLIHALRDDDPFVRTEACLVLGSLADVTALEPLTHTLAEDVASDVRAAAAEALGAFQHRQAILALAEHVGDDDLLIAYTCRQGLRANTGQDLLYDSTAWAAWIEGREDPFAAAGTLPPDPPEPADGFARRVRNVLFFWQTDPRDVIE